MSWNYRVFKETNEHGDVFVIREVYYYDKGDKIKAWTAEKTYPMGSSFLELLKDLAAMMHAFSLPILDLNELEKEHEKKTNIKKKVKS